MEWRAGPDLPQTVYFTASLQYKDTLALVGGYDISVSEYLDTIYLYDPEVEINYARLSLVH